jgi:hypothetical protein
MITTFLRLRGDERSQKDIMIYKARDKHRPGYITFIFHKSFHAEILKHFPSGNCFGRDIDVPFFGLPYERRRENPDKHILILISGATRIENF